MKRKILMILMSFVLVGCGKADVPVSYTHLRKTSGSK